MRDLKLAVRQVLKNPGFAAVAVLTLALGIGATTALFSVIYGVLISPYPYANPQDIWAPGLQSVSGDQTMRPYRLNEYQEMAKLPVFSQVMATGPGRVLLAGEFPPETVGGIRLSANAFQFLGVPPVLGRTIGPSDIRPNGEAEPVTVLSFRRWQKLFGGDTNVLGKTLRLDDLAHTIIGVMPPRFGWWTDDGLWLPLATNSREGRSVFPIVRLAQGVPPAAARDQLHLLQLKLAEANPSGFPRDNFTTKLTNYLDITQASGTMTHSLQLLFVAVGFLFLIACANVANLQLAKAASRGREMAIRLSIGARRGQLIRQLLTESVLLSLLGGLLGLLFAYWITHLTVNLMPGFLIPNESRIEINGRVLFFCLVASTFTGILFGLAPALHLSRPNVFETLKDEARGSSALVGGKTRALLVVGEVALSVVLLVSAGLTIRSFLALQDVRLGFRPEQVIRMDLPLSPKRYASLEQRNQFAQELVDRVRNLPGVQAVSIGNGGLPFGGGDSGYAIEGQPHSGDRQILLDLVSDGYLATLGIPLQRGRMLNDRDIRGQERVAVINETAAALWPAGTDPVGKRLRLDLLEQEGGPSFIIPTNASPYVTIVGVIGDAQNDDVRTKPRPAVFLPYTIVGPLQRSVVMRTQHEASGLMNAVRSQVREMDAEQPLNGPTTLIEMLDARNAQPRFTMALFTFFAALGLALATAGIYSVLSYLVSRRTREIGVRMALGASQGDVLGLIFRMGGRLFGAGLIVGLVVSFAVARVLGSQLDLFLTTSADPVSFLGVIVVLSLAALAACFVPAWRAARVDPTKALRHE